MTAVTATESRPAPAGLLPILARHHAFGGLDGARWLRFVGLHHHHHWKILRDVRRAAARV